MKRKIAAAFAALLISAAGIAHLSKSEGYRLTAYPDPATGGAPWTICRGHTGPEVHRGLTVTREQCDLWFAQDIAVAERALRRNVRVPMRQGQWDAYVSFVFNVGEGNFRTSKMLRLLNAGDWRGSCNQFPRWVYANKMKLNGLVTRRYEEQSICLTYGPYVYAP